MNSPLTRGLGYVLFCAVAFSIGCRRQPEGDREQISGRTNRFLRAIAHKDLDGAMSLWKVDSPQFVSTREDLRRLFASDRLRLGEIIPGRITFSGPERARSYVTVDLEAKDTFSGRPVEGYGRKQKLFDWAKEADVWKIVRYAPAEAELADALIAAKSAEDRARLTRASKQLFTSDLVRVLYREAAEAARNGRPEDALRLSDIAIETATSLGDRAALGWACIRKAEILGDRSDNAPAEALARRGLALFLEMKDRRGEAAARNTIATIYVRNADYDKAWREFQASLNLAKNASDRRLESVALANMGEVLRRSGKLDDAIKSFESGLETDRALGDRSGQVADLENIANVWQMKNENEKALALYRQCLTLDEDLRNKLGQAIDWLDMGTLEDAMSHYPEAIKSFEMSLKLDRETVNREGEAKALDDIGIVLMETGKLRESLEKYAESLELAVKIGDKGAQAETLSNQGAAHQLLGEYGPALVAFEESLRLEHESGNSVGEAISRGTIGDLYKNAGRFQEALELFAESVPVLAKEGVKLEEATSLHNMASTYQAMGQYGEAAAGYREALGIRRAIHDTAGEVVTLGSLAELYRIQGQLQTSIETARRGAELAHKIGNPGAEALNTLATADSLRLFGEPRESRKAYGEALQLAKKIGAPDTVAAAYTGFGSIDAGERNWTAAADDCEKAIGAVETMRSALSEPSLQIGFFGQNQKPYQCVVNSLLALHRNEDALRAAERARARTLTEVLDRAKVNVYAGLKTEDRQELQKLDGRVGELEYMLRQSPSVELLRDVKTARQARDDLKRVLYLKAPSLAVKRGETDPVSLADLKTLLPDSHAALLEYALGEEESWLFVLRGPGGRPELFAYRLKLDRQRTAKLVHGYRERLSKRGLEGPEGSELFQLLLAPAKDELAGVSSLGIVPDGSLWLLPFAALRDPDGQYLVQSKAIYYAPSLTALRVMDRTADKRRPAFEARLRGSTPSLLLVGNPSLGASHSVDLPLRGNFSELPETATEVKGIGSLPGIRADVLLGIDATEARVKQESGRYPVIHFATHGFYDSTNPMYSGIVLSQTGSSKDDGIWEAREIAEQNLNTELVVVSACDTARGEIFAGEGVIGLSWAFFVAGTPTSLLTTWQVNDKSTSLMMREFYQQWGIGSPRQRPNDKAVALQRAQKWMLAQKRYSDPYYWAPFVLIGSPR